MPNHYKGRALILQVFFPKKFKNIPKISQKKPEKAFLTIEELGKEYFIPMKNDVLERLRGTGLC